MSPSRRQFEEHSQRTQGQIEDYRPRAGRQLHQLGVAGRRFPLVKQRTTERQCESGKENRSSKHGSPDRGSRRTSKDEGKEESAVPGQYGFADAPGYAVGRNADLFLFRRSELAANLDHYPARKPGRQHPKKSHGSLPILPG